MMTIGETINLLYSGRLNAKTFSRNALQDDNPIVRVFLYQKDSHASHTRWRIECLWLGLVRARLRDRNVLIMSRQLHELSNGVLGRRNADLYFSDPDIACTGSIHGKDIDLCAS